MDKIRLVSGSYDNTIMIWNIQQGYSCLSVLKGHHKGILSVTSIESMIISSSKDNTIKIWDSENNYNCIKTLDDQFYR